MQEFNQGDTDTKLLVTLNELVTEANPVFVFTFTHVLTKIQVSFTKLPGDDESLYPERYNLFSFNPALFTQPGEWHYVVTEQVSEVILEQGKLLITRDFSQTKYDGGTSYKTYNG